MNKKPVNKSWQRFALAYWYTKCDQNRQEPPIIYIAPKQERKNGKR